MGISSTTEISTTTTMKFLIIAALIAVAAADSAYPAYPKGYDYPAMPYNFAYAVDDAASYNNFGHQESNDGKVTTGSYRVALPDGRTQIVPYKVDGYSGFVADVVYEGVAKYPEYSAPAYKAAAYPAPAYPTPAYPEPAYPAKY